MIEKGLARACEALCAEKKLGPFVQLWPSDQAMIDGLARAAITAYLSASAEPVAWIANDPEGGRYLTWSASAAAAYPNPTALYTHSGAPNV